jgi:hypothetical protein
MLRIVGGSTRLSVTDNYQIGSGDNRPSAKGMIEATKIEGGSSITVVIGERAILRRTTQLQLTGASQRHNLWLNRVRRHRVTRITALHGPVN